MKHLEWTKDLSVGVEKIDDQHKILFKIINDLEDKESIDIMNELTEYVRIHFETEEEYLEKESYPGLDEHREVHAKLTLKLLEVSKEFAEKDEEEKKKILEWLSNEILNHLIKEDSKYAEYLKSKGAKK